jgi:Zn-dependent protease
MRRHSVTLSINGLTISIHNACVAGASVLAASLALLALPDLHMSVAQGALPAAWILSILLHEGGHVAGAMRVGVRVHRIVLMPVGGATAFVREPQPGYEELYTALGGLLCSLALAIGCAGVSVLTTGAEQHAARSLALFNAGIFIANALPALPLDGGRVLRSIAWLHGRDGGQATRAVARTGLTAAYSMAVVAGVAWGVNDNLALLPLVAVAVTLATSWFLIRTAAQTLAVLETGGETRRPRVRQVDF